MATTQSHWSRYIHRFEKYPELNNISPTGRHAWLHSVALDCAVAGTAKTVYTVPEGKTLLVNSINHMVPVNISSLYDNIGDSATGNNPITCWSACNGQNIDFDYPAIFEKGITISAGTMADEDTAGFIFKGVLI